MESMRPVDDDARRRTLLIIWSAMAFSVLIYCFLAYTLSQGPGRRNLTDSLTGPLAWLPYLLPVLLYGLGGNSYNALALKHGRRSWAAVTRGFITMMAIFEINVIVGLVFFFLGTPLDKFLTFAVGTLLLDALALRRLMATWPRP
jgi:hypothetical protein